MEQPDTICWIDFLIGKYWRIPYPLGCVFFALACYVIACLPLAISGDFRLASETYLVLGTVGIAWVCFACQWATRGYRRSLLLVEDVIAKDSVVEFQGLVDQTLRRMGRWGWPLAISAVLWLIGVVLLTLVWYGIIRKTDARFLFFLSAEWYSASGKAPRLVTLAIFGMPPIAATVTTAYLLVMHIRLTFSMRRLRFASTARMCLRRVQPMLRVGIVSSFAWSVGVGLVASLFRTALDPYSLTLIGALGLIGTAGFVLPIVSLRQKLIEVRDTQVEELSRLIIAEQNKGKMKDLHLLLELYQLEEQVELNSRLDPIFVGWGYVAAFLSSVIVPLVIAVIQEKVHLLLKI